MINYFIFLITFLSSFYIVLITRKFISLRESYNHLSDDIDSVFSILENIITNDKFTDSEKLLQIQIEFPRITQYKNSLKENELLDHNNESADYN